VLSSHYNKTKPTLFVVCFITTGASFHLLALQFQLGRTTAWRTLKETTNIIWNVSEDEYILVPITVIWQKVSEYTLKNWNFLNCTGSTDGKHIELKCLLKSGYN
jgi:hypothetical protein